MDLKFMINASLLAIILFTLIFFGFMCYVISVDTKSTNGSEVLSNHSWMFYIHMFLQMIAAAVCGTVIYYKI